MKNNQATIESPENRHVELCLAVMPAAHIGTALGGRRSLPTPKFKMNYMENEPDSSVTKRERILGYLGIIMIMSAVLVTALIIVVKIQQKDEDSVFLSKRNAWRAAASSNHINNVPSTMLLNASNDAPVNSTAPDLGGAFSATRSH